MEEVYLPGKMEGVMKESTMKTLSKAMESSHGLTVGDMKELGLMESNMELELTILQLVHQNKANGGTAVESRKALAQAPSSLSSSLILLESMMDK
jgi:hypothetical protein